MMNRTIVIALITVCSIGILTAFIKPLPFTEKPIPISPSVQRSGDSAKGYNYLLYGNFLKSGYPVSAFNWFVGKDKRNLLNRTGKAAEIPFGFNIVQAENGTDIVIPTCLQCHAQEFEGKLYVGLGNATIDFTQIKAGGNFIQKAGTSLLKLLSPKQFEASKAITQSLVAIAPYLATETRGVNAADRLATLLVAHRNPETLEWQNQPLLSIPPEVVPTDVPAWWLLKKKNAMFYTGFGRGDFGKFLMLSNLLTVKDTVEAAEVNSHFGDVLAFIKSVQPPKFPYPINEKLATQGEVIFTNNCSKCHGTYGPDGQYPNLLVPASIIQTDSLLYQSNYQNPQFIDWFNKSWFAKGTEAAKLEPFNGYIAPPLDGIWITAPYLHNGSVPTLDALLNSKERPTYWIRDFENLTYDYEKIGWKFTTEKSAKAKGYNTELKGYNNSGHYFGDKLTKEERKALLEYLKTL